MATSQMQNLRGLKEKRKISKTPKQVYDMTKSVGVSRLNDYRGIFKKL